MSRFSQQEANSSVAELEQMSRETPGSQVIVDADRRRVVGMVARRDSHGWNRSVAKCVADETVITQRWQQDDPVQAHLAQQRGHLASELRAVAIPGLQHQVIPRFPATVRRT